MGSVLAWLTQSRARPPGRDELIHFGGGPGKLDREPGGERTSTHTQGGQPGSALPRLRQEPHVPVKGRSLGVCPPPALGSPVPQPWAEFTCGLSWRKVAARGSREAGGTAVSPRLQLLRSWSEGMAVTQVFPRGDGSVPGGVGHPRQDRPRPGTRVLLEPLSSDCAQSFPREPAWDTPPWRVPWCPSRASATFIPRTGTPGAQLRGHHFEFTTALCAALGLPRHRPVWAGFLCPERPCLGRGTLAERKRGGLRGKEGASRAPAPRRRCAIFVFLLHLRPNPALKPYVGTARLCSSRI